MSKSALPAANETDLLGLSRSFNDKARQAEGRAQQLESEAREARKEASELRRNAQLLEEAHRIVARENATVIASRTFDALLGDKGKGARIVLLVDGSGSMNGPYIEAAMNTALNVTGKVTANGGSVETFIFGDREPLQIDINDAGLRARIIKNTLNTGTDLAPAIEKIAKTLKKSQRTHIVILGDGDVFDAEIIKPAIENLLRDFPKASLDAVQLNYRKGDGYYSFGNPGNSPNTTSSLARLVAALEPPEGKQAVKISFVEPAVDSVSSAVGALLNERLPEKANPKKRPAPKP